MPKDILDIGAYHGMWTVQVKSIFPNSNYTLIEAINYNELNKFNNDSKVTYMIKLLADTEKQVDWYQKCNTGDSIFRENTKHFENCKIIKKNTSTLDNLFSDKKFDLIKIDVQGAEILVLKGGNNLIKNTSFIILELPFMGEYNKSVPNFLEHIKYMDSIGFIPYDIVELHKNENILIQIDIIFINKTHPINKIVQNKINNFGS